MNCTACNRPLNPPAQLCTACVRGLGIRLSELPAQYLLLGAHLRPGASRSDGPVALVREAPLPVREDVLDMRADGGMVSVLESWREAMQAARGWGRPARTGTIERRVLAAARGLQLNIEWIAGTFEAAGDMAREIRALAGEVNALLDPDPATLRVGDCAADLGGEICGAPLRVPAGTTTVRCRRCGTDYPPHTWMTLATGAWTPADGAAACAPRARANHHTDYATIRGNAVDFCERSPARVRSRFESQDSQPRRPKCRKPTSEPRSPSSF